MVVLRNCEESESDKPIECSEELTTTFRGMHLKDAAKHLKASRYTMKRACRAYKISKWPPREQHKLIGQSRPNESPVVVDQVRMPQLNSNVLLPSNQVSTSIDTNSVTVKAIYESETFEFKLSKRPWEKAELEEQVKKRLELEAGTYRIKYKDEDNDLISIRCDEDLQDYIDDISSSRPQGTTSVVVLLEQISS